MAANPSSYGGYTRTATPDFGRYTEGYYYYNPNAPSGMTERSQDEMRHLFPGVFDPGNSDLMQSLVYSGRVVPRLYTQAEVASWGGPPGGFSDYQASLWGQNYDLALAQFLARIPSQYLGSGLPSGAQRTTTVPAGGVFTGSAPAGGGFVPQGGVFPNAEVPTGGIRLDGEITKSSLPTRELADRVAGAGTYQSVSETYASQFAPGAPSMGGIPSWMLIAAAGVALYLVMRK